MSSDGLSNAVIAALTIVKTSAVLTPCFVVSATIPNSSLISTPDCAAAVAARPKLLASCGMLVLPSCTVLNSLSLMLSASLASILYAFNAVVRRSVEDATSERPPFASCAATLVNCATSSVATPADIA